MLTVIFLGFLAVVAIFLAMVVINGRSRQAQGKSGEPVQRKEDQQVAPKTPRASGLD